MIISVCSDLLHERLNSLTFDISLVQAIILSMVFYINMNRYNTFFHREFVMIIFSVATVVSSIHARGVSIKPIGLHRT